MPIVLGLDIGYSAIKAALLEDTMHGERVKRLFHMPYKGMERKEAIDQFFQEVFTDEFDRLVVSLKGYEGSVRILELPFDDVKKVASVLPFELDAEFADGAGDKEFEFHRIHAQRVTSNFPYLVIGVRQDCIAQYLEDLKGSEQSPYLLDYDAYANFNCYFESKDHQKEGVKLLVDIGARSTGINIINDEELLYTRSVFFGGKDFSQAIADRLNMSFEDAEEMKLVYGLESASSEEGANLVVEALCSCLDFLAKEIRLTLGSYSSLQGAVDVQCLYLYGGGSMLKGCEDYLTQMLDIPVQLANPLQELKIEETPSQSPQLFSVAIGLAYRGLGIGQVQHDFLPRSNPLDTYSQKRILMHCAAVMALSFIFAVSSGIELAAAWYTHYDLKNVYDEETDKILASQKGKQVYSNIQELHRRIGGRKKLLERFRNAERSPIRVLDYLSSVAVAGLDIQFDQIVMQNDASLSQLIIVGSVPRAPDLVKWETQLDKIPGLKKRERPTSQPDSKTGRYTFKQVLDL